MWLRYIAVSLCRINECVPCSNFWILLPGIYTARSLRSQLHEVAVLCTAYGVLESLMISVLAWIGMRASVQPWNWVLNLSPNHLWVCWISTLLFERFARPQYHGDKAISEGQPVKRSQGHQHLWPLLPAVFSTATVNSALLLFCQSLYAPPWQLDEYRHLSNLLGPFAFVLFVGCSLGMDIMVYRETRIRIRRCGPQEVVNAISGLILLSVTRVSIRILLGIEPLLAFHTPSLEEAKRAFIMLPIKT